MYKRTHNASTSTSTSSSTSSQHTTNTHVSNGNCSQAPVSDFACSCTTAGIQVYPVYCSTTTKSNTSSTSVVHVHAAQTVVSGYHGYLFFFRDSQASCTGKINTITSTLSSATSTAPEEKRAKMAVKTVERAKMAVKTVERAKMAVKTVENAKKAVKTAERAKMAVKTV